MDLGTRSSIMCCPIQHACLVCRGALWIDAGYACLEQCDIQGSGSKDGGVVYQLAGEVDVVDSRVSNSRAGHSAGVGYHSGGTARYLRTRIEGDTSGTTSVFVYAGGHIHLLNSNLIYSISRESWGPWIGDGAQGTFECRKSWITATIGNNATLFANTAQGVAFTLCSVQSVTVANHPVQLIGARNSVFRPALGNLSQS